MYTLLVTSHGNDNRPVMSRQQISYQNDDFTDDTIDSWDSEVGAGIAYDKKRENTNQPATAQPERDRSSNVLFQLEKEVRIASELQPKFHNMFTLLWYDTHPKSMRGHTTSMGFSQCEYKNCQYKSYLTETDTEPTRPFYADAILIQSAGIFAFESSATPG